MPTDGPPEHVVTGREYLEASQGAGRAEEILARMAELHPDLPRHVIDHGLDPIYTRPGLTLQQRQLITVVAIASQGDVDFQLSSHLDAALNLGITEEELRETLLQLSVYVGFPRSMNALGVLRDVLAERG